MIRTPLGTWETMMDGEGELWFKLVGPPTGFHVQIKDTYADEGRTIPVTGTIKDTVDYGNGDKRLVVLFDEETIETGKANGMAGVPPGGEFSPDQLALLEA